MIFGSVPTHLRFGSCGSFSFTGSMTPRFVPVRVCRFVSVRGHTENLQAINRDRGSVGEWLIG